MLYHCVCRLLCYIIVCVDVCVILVCYTDSQTSVDLLSSLCVCRRLCYIIVIQTVKHLLICFPRCVFVGVCVILLLHRQSNIC